MMTPRTNNKCNYSDFHNYKISLPAMGGHQVRDCRSFAILSVNSVIIVIISIKNKNNARINSGSPPPPLKSGPGNHIFFAIISVNVT